MGISCYKNDNTIYNIPGILGINGARFIKIIQCKFDDQREIIMNSIVLFVFLLQVLTALCARCHMSGGRNGYCVRRKDCNVNDESLSVASCHGTPLYCCPPDSLTINLQSALTKAAQEFKFPTDCGFTEMYPREQIFGGDVIQPDEYSWIASLRYGYEGANGCGGSVINSRYVLTAAHCTADL